MSAGLSLTEFWESDYWQWSIAMRAYHMRLEDQLELAAWSSMWVVRMMGNNPHVTPDHLLGRAKVEPLEDEFTD